MPHILKNKNLEVFIDLPHENYRETRFDWSGKIIKAIFNGITFGITEKPNKIEQNLHGRGLYNEFGIDSPLGFNETKQGDWFHKIGVGLLKKEMETYAYINNYELKPCEFSIKKEETAIQFECTSELVNGYSYILKKEIKLFENGFKINYYLKNIGDKPIETTEYNHNFLAIGNKPMDSEYILKFPFQLNADSFQENVNPEQLVDFNEKKLSFLGSPNEVFFFSYLNGNDKVKACWQLENSKLNVGIQESGDFLTSKINLWGCKHVISPELFFKIELAQSESVTWSRTYDFYNHK